MGYVIDVADLAAEGRSVGGGKAVNLGRMLRAGLPVPAGFCVTTRAYVEAVAPAVADDVAALIAVLGDAGRSHPAGPTGAGPTGTGPVVDAAPLRARIEALPIPGPIAAEIRAAYAELGAGFGAGAATAVAVRSSATAEDLAEASFAGQQDTFLGVVGADAVLDAVRRCWASLWTDRAVSYRASLGIDQASVALAVVVQRMVDARAAGVLFTANPVTGCRTETVIDAALGLGESVVSGAVNPDRVVARTADGVIVSQLIGDKRLAIRQRPGGGVEQDETVGSQVAARPALTADEVRALAGLARKVADLYGVPMDIEWAVDRAGTAWLTQARPVTTLFPAPEDRNLPMDRPGRRVFLNLSLAQGIVRPMTPLGQAAFRHISASVARAAGYPLVSPHDGARSLQILGGRLFADITTAYRHPVARRLLMVFFGFMEARAAQVLADLGAAEEFGVDRETVRRTAPHLARLLAVSRLPVNAAVAVRDPELARQRIFAIIEDAGHVVAAAGEPGAAASSDVDPEARLDAVEAALGSLMETMPRAAGYMISGFLALGVAQRLLGQRARPGDLEVVMRGLPHNVTTMMDLDLWDLSRRLLHDPSSLAALRGRSAPELTADWRAAALPEALATGLGAFLARWGDRAVAELDLGMPRWRADPTYLFGVLKNYIALASGPTDPRASFMRGAAEAEAMVAELVRRCADQPVRRRVVAAALDRTRRLAGMRENPKFALMRSFGAISAELAAIGAELVARGAIDGAEDRVFLDLREVRRGLTGVRLQEIVAARRAEYAVELGRRHLPRILLSDGTEPEAALVRARRPGELAGTPASSGLVTGVARVVLDPSEARLDPGEILVAPSTDPGWTPLFLTAGALVMEMGGANSHGAVVAREYGIPAVVGVPDAVTLIRTGQRVTVDGASGLVRIEDGVSGLVGIEDGVSGLVGIEDGVSGLVGLKDGDSGLVGIEDGPGNAP